ncbi:hypothetical protein GR160_08015 [Flavobacterium sp. Sd200]|uniref:hypothetical protein n=1 Tax=Flavobacterium sp. Sd200 TaxID=2692211 RepID=UPI0013713885|nr:hypothetical protein [Flavobacterium sp. Sd200]MXN91174.1 hypothetical protein [Flavobacterium sp. Sd200]
MQAITDLEGYRATLHVEGKPEEKRQHYFGMKYGHEINPTQAYNLLLGRAIEKDGKWLQFDLNDKDAQGNFRVKEFHSGYGYDLDKSLQSLPLRDHKNGAEIAAIKQQLLQGQRVEVSFLKDGNERRYFIEANPQHKSVNIYDEHSRKISLNTALSAKIIEAVKIADYEQVKELEKQPKK